MGDIPSWSVSLQGLQHRSLRTRAVGDMAQPRGGRLRSEHDSHQIGLGPDGDQLDPNTWQPADRTFIRLAAEQPEVERIFVNPAIKKALCETRAIEDQGKVRPWYGHRSHVNVRLRCPVGALGCKKQTPHQQEMFVARHSSSGFHHEMCFRRCNG
jgi:penicillin-insensitive murein DD-endopeptidase